MGKEYKEIPILILSTYLPAKLPMYCFFRLCLKVFKTVVLFINSGRLLHREGPVYGRPFCPILFFRKGTLSLTKLLLDSILH